MLPPSFDLSKYPTEKTIRLLASLLDRMTTANDQLNKAAVSTRKGDVRRSSSASVLGSSEALTNSTLVSGSTTSPTASDSYTRFHARSIPSIDIYSYLSRILKYCPCANECFLSLLVYFDRMSKNALAFTGQPFSIDSYNIHRLIIAGVMVSSKFFSDVFYTNTRYAKVGGLPVSELNSLELEFLFLNDFNLTVPISELQRYGDQLLKVGIMEQEMRKNMMYDTPTYTNGGTIRHGRSTSLGSNAPLVDQRKSWDQSVDRLCDMATRMSMDDNDLNRRSTNDGVCGFQTNYSRTSFNQPTYLSYGHGYALPKVPSNGNLRSNVRRMASYGNLRQPHSPHHNRQFSDGLPQSPVALDAMDSDAVSGGHSSFTQSMPYARVSSPLDSQYANRHSQEWTHQQPSPSSPSRPTRQRHGSMGFNNGNRPDGWQRTPRQSRSSINLYQQGGFWKPTPPGVVPDQQTSAPSSMRRLSLTAIYAPPFIPYNEMLHANNSAYYSSAYHSHPAGIPTPPASSSPVHQKQSTPPPPPAHQYPSSQQPYPVMYL